MDRTEVCTSTNNALERFRGANRQLAETIIEIVRELREYWPLTVRQVFYQIVARLALANSLKGYRAVSRNLALLRREDILPWHCVEDRTRRTIDKRGVPNVTEFIRGQTKEFLNPRYYGRCYIQEQDVYVEVATEKDALASVIEEAERFENAVMLGKRPILLYLGDFDYSGVAIPKALIRNATDWHGVEVELRRVALNPAQVAAYGLPEDPGAGKPLDPNRGAFIAEYGDVAPVELDALHPQALIEIVRGALDEVYDMSEVAEQIEIEKRERSLLAQMRRSVDDHLHEYFPKQL